MSCTYINYDEMTVEDGGILYEMEDLAKLHYIYERLCAMEYLYDNQQEDKPITKEQAYQMADYIRGVVDGACECESDAICNYYNNAYWYVIGAK